MSGQPADRVPEPTCVVLSGGVGGAKLCLGLSKLIAGPELAVIVNCGDDFQHFGLHVSPDIDTVMYTLAGVANRENGWGMEDETWSFMAAMEQLGGETWFNLGDKDLATNVLRTHKKLTGQKLSVITAELCTALGVSTRILPATDDPLRTMLETDAGVLDLQNYLVRQRAQPTIRAIAYEGAESAAPAPGVVEALRSPALRAVIIGPSNPFVSINPILAVPGIADALGVCKAPVIAVSPIVAGQAVKGPAAKMFREFGIEPSALEVARHYGGLIDGFVLDNQDASLAADIRKLNLRTAITNTVMTDIVSKIDLAKTTLALADHCRASGFSRNPPAGQASACG